MILLKVCKQKFLIYNFKLKVVYLNIKSEMIISIIFTPFLKYFRHLKENRQLNMCYLN